MDLDYRCADSRNVSSFLSTSLQGIGIVELGVYVLFAGLD